MKPDLGDCVLGGAKGDWDLWMRGELGRMFLTGPGAGDNGRKWVPRDGDCALEVMSCGLGVSRPRQGSIAGELKGPGFVWKLEMELLGVMGPLGPKE